MDLPKIRSGEPQPSVELLEELSPGDLNDLCDATDEAIQAGGGFGWVSLPSREILERYWKGVIAMPSRLLFVARLDNVICGTAQIILPAKNNEAQSFAVTLTTNFVAPWGRGHGLARMLLKKVEETSAKDGYSVINLDLRETQDAAIRLYENAGYIHVGTHPYYAKVDKKVIPGRYYYKVLDEAIEQTP